jgi:hypothetical protein
MCTFLNHPASSLNTVSDSARLDKTGKTRLGSYTKIIVQNVGMFLNHPNLTLSLGTDS